MTKNGRYDDRNLEKNKIIGMEAILESSSADIHQIGVPTLKILFQLIQIKWSILYLYNISCIIVIRIMQWNGIESN